MATTATTTPAGFENVRQPGLLHRILSSQITYVLAALVILMIVMTIGSDKFLTERNLQNVAQNFSYIAIAALGQTLVIILAGIDLSVGSVMAVGAVATSLAMEWSADWGIFIDLPGLALAFAVLAGVAAGGVVGLANGILIARLNLSPFVTTLGMLSVCRSLVYVVTQGRGSPTAGPAKDLFRTLGNEPIFGAVPPSLIYMVLLGLAIWFLLRHMQWGRHVFAIGGNERAAGLTGVPVERIKISVYVFCGALAGFTGVLLLSWLGSAPANTAVGYELRVIAASVIGGANLTGGIGGPLGAITGAALIEVIRNGLILSGVQPYWQDFFVGVFIILAVLLDRIRSRRAG
jgi:ribose transport system permease protein